MGQEKSRAMSAMASAIRCLRITADYACAIFLGGFLDMGRVVG